MIERKNSVTATEVMEGSIDLLKNDQWKFMEELEAEYKSKVDRRGKKAEKVTKVWLESLNLSRS